MEQVCFELENLEMTYLDKEIQKITNIEISKIRGLHSLMKEYIEERALAVAGYIIESNATVRQAARQFGISKSTVHKDITERLMQVNPALAKEARKVLDINKSERHIRGGMATKEKYEHEHLLHACQRAVS